MWDLRKLEKSEADNEHGDYHDDLGLEFNFCRYLDMSLYFARYYDFENYGTERLTNDNYAPDLHDPIKDENGDYTGISTTHISDNVCTTDADGNPTAYYSFNAKVMCDAENDE